MKGIYRVIFVLILLAMLVSFIFLIIISLLSIYGSEPKKEKESITYEYKHYYRKNKSNMSTFVGFVLMPTKIEDGYLYYEDYLGNSNLIAELGSSPYQCTGSCVCESSSERRSSGISSLSKNFVYLLSAFSSVAAWNIAKDHFSEECVNRFSEECEKGHIKSEVDECEKIDDIEEIDLVDWENLVEEENEYHTRHKGFKFKGEWLCKGNCVRNKRKSFLGSKEARVMSKEFGCEKIRLQSNVRIESDNAYWYDRTHHIIATQKFTKNLDDICKERSLKEIEIESDGEKKMQNIHLCDGYFKNESIECEKIKIESNREDYDDGDKFHTEWSDVYDMN